MIATVWVKVRNVAQKAALYGHIRSLPLKVLPQAM
jgi:hypothetical protein